MSRIIGSTEDPKVTIRVHAYALLVVLMDGAWRVLAVRDRCGTVGLPGGTMRPPGSDGSAGEVTVREYFDSSVTSPAKRHEFQVAACMREVAEELGGRFHAAFFGAPPLATPLVEKSCQYSWQTAYQADGIVCNRQAFYLAFDLTDRARELGIANDEAGLLGLIDGQAGEVTEVLLLRLDELAARPDLNHLGDHLRGVGCKGSPGGPKRRNESLPSIIDGILSSSGGGCLARRGPSCSIASQDSPPGRPSPPSSAPSWRDLASQTSQTSQTTRASYRASQASPTSYRAYPTSPSSLSPYRPPAAAKRQRPCDGSGRWRKRQPSSSGSE